MTSRDRAALAIDASPTNYLLADTKGQPVPVVGMGATVLLQTARHAATIIGVCGTRVGIQLDKAVRNGYSANQSYTYERNPEATIEWYSLRKNGAYIRCGDSINGQHLRIGDRDEYHNFNFSFRPSQEQTP
jgi:hypothetical protein